MIGAQGRFRAERGAFTLQDWSAEWQQTVSVLDGEACAVSEVDIEGPDGQPLYVTLQFAETGDLLPAVALVHFEPVRVE